MKRTSLTLVLPVLTATVWVAAQPPAAPHPGPVKVVAPVLVLPPQAVQTTLLTMLDAVEANDYANFSRAIDGDFKASLPNAMFEAFSQSLVRRLEKGYAIYYMGDLSKSKHHTFVWKLVFADKSDEVLTTISFKNVAPGEPFGKVTGFYVH